MGIFLTTFRLLVCCLMFTLLSFAQDNVVPERRFTRERLYDVIHYLLDIAINEKTKTCGGSVTISLRPLRPGLNVIHLDAAEMKILDIVLNKQSLAFTHSHDSLLVTLDKFYALNDTLQIKITYNVQSPRKGLYFVKPDSGYPLKQLQVWSQGEPEDNRYWFPCYDYPNDKSTSEMYVTVNDPKLAVSNGLLIDTKRDAKKGTVTYHWRENKPHVSYCISVAVGDYVEIKDSWGTVPIRHYVYKHQVNDATRSFEKTPKMLEYFSTIMQYPYPWEKYGHVVVQDFMFSGQENVSLSTLTDVTIHDSRAHLDVNSDGLVAHELAHQWWGDLVSFRDWSHAWLSEGFATYFDFLFQGYDKGNDELDRLIAESQTGITAADVGNRRRPTVFDRYKNPSELFDNRIYGKGACVLHMLRYVLGDELFWNSIRHYIRTYAYKNVTTEDFKIAIEEVTGQNLHWFFDQWVYRAGYPEFNVTTSWDQLSRSVRVHVRQTQKADSLTGVFKTPADIEVWVHGNPETYRVMIEDADEEFSFPAYQQPQLVIFDKGNHLLKKADQKKTEEEWIFQLQNATDAVDRLHASEELRWIVDKPRVKDALTKAMLEDRFWGVRREAAWALGDAREVTGDSLIVAYGDRDARVRAAVVASLAKASGEQVITTLLHAFEKDSSYTVNGAALRSLQQVDTANAKTYCLQALGKNSHNETIRTAALRAISLFKDTQAFDTVKSFSMYGIDRNLRVLSVTLLAQVWKDRKGVPEYIMSLAGDPSFHVRRAVIEALGTMNNPLAIPVLKERMEKEPDGRLVKAAGEALEKIQQARK